MSDINERFAKVEITGGPHGHNTRYLVDGVLQRSVSRAEVVFDVNDAIRIKTYQFGVVSVNVEVKSGAVVHAVRVVVHLNSDDGAGYEVLAESEAATLWQAVADCAGQLRLREESEQEQSTGDTVGVPQDGTAEVVNGQDQEAADPGA